MSLGELKQVIKEIYPARMRCLSSSSSNGNPCQNPVVSQDGRPDSANHNGRTHEKTGLAIALLAMMGASTAVWAQDQEQRTAKVGQCAGLQPADVAAQVKRDFLQNRITRWRRTKAAGHRNPDRPGQPGCDHRQGPVWQVPLTVRGTKMDKTYNVTLNCNTGEIAYSAPQ